VRGGGADGLPVPLVCQSGWMDGRTDGQRDGLFSYWTALQCRVRGG